MPFGRDLCKMDVLLGVSQEFERDCVQRILFQTEIVLHPLVDVQNSASSDSHLVAFPFSHLRRLKGHLTHTQLLMLHAGHKTKVVLDVQSLGAFLEIVHVEIADIVARDDIRVKVVSNIPVHSWSIVFSLKKGVKGLPKRDEHRRLSVERKNISTLDLITRLEAQ